MDREGPGFVIDVFLLWLVLLCCLVVAEAIVSVIAGPIGVAAAAGASLLIVFGALLVYYRWFLDETPIVGQSDRGAFVLVVVQVAIVAFVLGGLLSPPDPFRQLLAATVGIVVGIPIAYWLVFRHRNHPSGDAG